MLQVQYSPDMRGTYKDKTLQTVFLMNPPGNNSNHPEPSRK